MTLLHKHTAIDLNNSGILRCEFLHLLKWRICQVALQAHDDGTVSYDGHMIGVRLQDSMDSRQ